MTELKGSPISRPSGTIGNNSGAGAVSREYVWLADTPVALITHPNATVYFLQPDHLNTPRVLTNAANAILWRWDSDPFGVSPPDQDPDGDSNPFVLNLRFPGQYFDAETGLHYNYFRDYDPQTGRYIQSDPIGLDGGINTYGYVGARPLERIDPLGLFLTSVDAACVQNPELCAEIGGQIVENAGALSGEQCTEEAAHSAAEAIRTLGTAAIVTGIVKGAAAGAESAARGAVSLERQATDLVRANAGRSRVTLRSPSRQLEVDLQGRAHGGVPTPHTRVSERNLQAPRQPAYNTRSADTRPATQEDIRTVRRYLERQDR